MRGHPQLQDLLREVIEADRHTNVAWKTDVNAKVDQPLLPWTCQMSKDKSR